MPSGWSGLLWVAALLHLLAAAHGQGSVDADAAALLALKGALQNAATLDTWVEGQSPCSGWTGVNCTNGRVTSLDLHGMGLKGTLPPGMSDMSALTYLDLSRNSLTGTLPPQWSFPALRNMSLAANKLAGELPAAWSGSMPVLVSMAVQDNGLEGTLPAGWAADGGFATPFTAVLQSGNTGFCGPIDPAPGYSLLFRGGEGQHTLVTTLGSCAQGSCGKAAINSSAPNLYDLSWANGAAPLDVEAFNANVPASSVPLSGTPVTLPCYPEAPPAFFGSNVAYQKATWQSTTDGSQSSALAVAGQGVPGSTAQCSVTTDSPGWWVVDLQQSTTVQAVLLYAGAEMSSVEVRVGNQRDPTANPLCTGNISLKTRQGLIIVCENILKGRYMSVVATQSKLSLCRVEVYSLATNAALGKYTAASSGDAAMVTNGNAASTQCSTVTSSESLATWITVDLGYSAPVSTVVISNGASTFQGDLNIRLGDQVVVTGNENPLCATGLTLQPVNTLPVQCLGNGRYVTLWVQRTAPSTMYICEVYVYLSGGPSAFGGPSPYAPPPTPSPVPSPSPAASPSPSPSPSPPVGPISPSVDYTTTQLDVLLVLTGAGINPSNSTTRDGIVAALEAVWTASHGMTGVQFVDGRMGDQAAASPETTVEVVVATPAGAAPGAANYIVLSTANGEVLTALDAQDVGASNVTLLSVAAFAISPSPSPPPAPADSGGSSVSVGVIVGAVVGALAAVALAVGLFVYMRRRRGSAPGSPKSGDAMEQGRLGLGPLGGKDGGAGVDVAAVSGGGSAPSKLLVPDPSHQTQGPPDEVLSFLSQDPPEAALALANGTPHAPEGGAVSTTPLSLSKQKSLAKMGSGVSELWLVNWGELDLQKQIGEGSFGKVHLAKWRETTVAVKVLSNTGVSSSLEEEFPAAGDGAGTSSSTHPLFESLQKEAAMMASLRHPSIVMYLGVCLDPPAVVTEYCARGSLNDVLKRARASTSLAAQLDWPRRLNMALDAAKGMLYLHSCTPPIIHRDLKSPNLLVDKHWRVKVCDFNLSRVMEDSVVLSSVAATNPRWLAPEILSGKGYTYASDVYAFGIILWEFMTWQVPWHEYGPWQVVAMVTEAQKRPEVPALEALPSPAFAGMADYLQLMAECWAQDPAQRPSFAAVISRLRKMLALEAQRQRAHSGATPRYRESPSRASSGAVEGYGAETPVVRSRPIVSIYDLSGSEAGAGGGNGGASAGVRTPSRHPSSFSQRGSDDLAATTSHGTLEPGPGVSTLESLATLPESLPEPAPPGQEARLPPIRGGMAEDGE